VDAFEHRRLEVYRTAVRFAALAERIARALPLFRLSRVLDRLVERHESAGRAT